MSTDQFWQNCDPLHEGDHIDVEIKCEVPQILTLEDDGPGESEEEEEEELLVGAPLPIKLSVKKAAPVVLKSTVRTYSQPRRKNPYQAKANSAPLQTKDQFFKEGKSKIIGIINEARRLGIDPREYHPFYLRVHKHIADGQRLGYIGIEEEDVEELWREYDELMDQVPVKEVYLEGEWENSPYALYIEKRIVCDRNGRRIYIKRDRQALENRFKELRNVAGRISSSTAAYDNDLQARLEFLKESRAMIHPADVVRMNAIWKKFRKDCCRKSDTSSGTSCTFTGNEDEVPERFRCRILLKDIAEDGIWGTRVKELYLKREGTATVLEIPYSPPPSPAFSPSSDGVSSDSSASYSPSPPSKKRKTVSRSTRSRSRTQIRSRPKPKKPVVRISKEVIVKASPPSYPPSSPLSYSASSPLSKKRKNSVRQSSSRNRNRSRTHLKSGSRKTSKPKPKKPEIKLSGAELAKKKLREKRLTKFKRSWGKLQWSLKMICRRRCRWQILRIRRSEKVTLTLEKVVSKSCRLRLRTLKNRKIWMKQEEKRKLAESQKTRSCSVKVGVGEPEPVPCPHCNKMCKTEISKSIHTAKKHPEIYAELKALQPKNRKSRYKATGDEDEPCPHCGRMFKDDHAVRTHMAMKHPKKFAQLKALQPKKQRSKEKGDVPCPHCDRMCKNEHSLKMHVAVKHPKNFAEFKALQPQQKRMRGNEVQLEKRRERKQAEGGNTKTPSKQVVCDQCGKTLYYTQSLKKHIALVHNPNRSRCPTCNEAFSDGTVLWFHFQSKHMNYDVVKLSKAKADRMGLQLRTTTLANQPPALEEFPGITKVENAVGLEEFRCNLCEKTFDYLEIAKRHLTQVHQDEKQWLCDICGKTFKGKDNREAHIRQVHQGAHRCDICGRSLQGKGKLWRHKVEFHHMTDLKPPEGITVEVCPYCGLTMLRGMQAHVKKHHPEKLVEFVELEKEKAEVKKGSIRAPHSKKARQNYKKLRKEQERKWVEEGILEAPWLATKRRPKNKCPFCGVSMAEIKSWREHLYKLCEGNPPTKKPGSVTVPKFICPVDGCDEKFYNRVRGLNYHIMNKHCGTYNKLEKKEYVSMKEYEDFTPKEYHCMVCKKADTEVKMATKGEVIVHFVMNHPRLYNQNRGEMEPEVEENGELELDNTKSKHQPQPQLPKKSATVTHAVSVPAPLVFNPKKYPCPHCPVELYSDLDLRCHIEVTHEDKCWRCPDPTCTKVILSPDEMEKHFMEDHTY